MTRAMVALLAAVLPVVAFAQDFPLTQPYKVISISGFDVQKAGITLTASRGAERNRLAGAGNAGCNSWSGALILNEDRLDVADVVTTKKFCGKPRMTTEEAFLTTLKSVHRWRLDGGKLILEGDAGRLMLMPDKTPAKPAR